MTHGSDHSTPSGAITFTFREIQTIIFGQMALEPQISAQAAKAGLVFVGRPRLVLATRLVYRPSQPSY